MLGTPGFLSAGVAARWIRHTRRVLRSAQASVHPSQAVCYHSTKASVFRHNKASNDWVVYASGRSDRPDQFHVEVPEPVEHPHHVDTCPFCRGNEEGTGEARLSFGPDGIEHSGECPTSDDWQLRVVANKFPVVCQSATPPGDVNYLDHPPTIEGHGLHEVVIETPLHHSPLSSRTVDQVAMLVKAWVRRGVVMRETPGVQHVTAFKNQGRHAGVCRTRHAVVIVAFNPDHITRGCQASIHHPHAQLVTLPIVPFEVLSRVDHSTRYFAKHCECVFCSNLRDEETAAPLGTYGSRIVAANDAFVAFVPFAALTPFQVWITPRKHMPSAFSMSDADIAHFADCVARVTRQLDGALAFPDYNLVLHNAPAAATEGTSAASSLVGPFKYNGVEVSQAHHWYADMFPRLRPGGMAGFELGSMIFSNSSLPEDNAAQLRDVVSL